MTKTVLLSVASSISKFSSILFVSFIFWIPWLMFLIFLFLLLSLKFGLLWVITYIILLFLNFIISLRIWDSKFINVPLSAKFKKYKIIWRFSFKRFISFPHSRSFLTVSSTVFSSSNPGISKTLIGFPLTW